MSSTRSQRVIPTTMSHRIPHRFQNVKQFSPHSCNVCKKLIWGINGAVGCTECDYICHEKCVDNAPTSCGLSFEMLSSAIECAEKARSTTDRVVAHDFQQKHFPSPILCALCDNAIWGMHGQGLQCSKCQCSLHQQCYTKIASGIETIESCMDEDQDEPFESTAEENQTVEIQDSSLDRRRSRSFKTDTLLRLSRKRYQLPAISEIFNVPQSRKQSTTIIRTRSATSENELETQFQRRTHHFRGHEFLATYLDLPDSEEPKSCDHCNKVLGDGGRQCYQCRSCQMNVHKKCYTLLKPCHVTIGRFDEAEKIAEKDDDDHVSMIQYRNSLRLSKKFSSRKEQDFIEDFTDELIRSRETQNEHQKDMLYDYVFEDSILGSGQYGVVKTGAYKHNPQQKIAVKIIDKKRFWDPLQKMNSQIPKEMPNILKRELDILKKLDHPGIIRMHHFIDTPTQTLIIMDLAPNGDLLDYIMKQGRINEHETKHIARQVLNALKYLHGHGIVHRDLKPENLLLTIIDGQIKVQIADFGFATMMEQVCGASSHMLQSVVGTPAYQAPEIVDSRVWSIVNPGSVTAKGYSKTADMWSFGVILYVCLGGVFPFDSQKPILDQILRGEFFFPDEYFNDVGDEAVDFICRLLCVDPQKRLDCDRALQHVWIKN